MSHSEKPRGQGQGQVHGEMEIKWGIQDAAFNYIDSLWGCLLLKCPSSKLLVGGGMSFKSTVVSQIFCSTFIDCKCKYTPIHVHVIMLDADHHLCARVWKITTYKKPCGSSLSFLLLLMVGGTHTYLSSI